jgi:hypothetical protein
MVGFGTEVLLLKLCFLQAISSWIGLWMTVPFSGASNLHAPSYMG